MKLLYIAPIKIVMNRLDGVAKKVLGQVKVFSSEYEVLLLCRNDDNVVLYNINSGEYEILGKGSSKLDILREAFNIIRLVNINYCYIRYPNSDPVFLSLLKKMKQKNICVVVEIPTYPYDDEGKETIKGRIVGLIDIFYRKRLYHYVDRIITYSKDNNIFNVKTIKTINGFDFEKVNISKSIYNGNTIHLCGVAIICRVNGYDRLIKGLGEYYKNGGKFNIIFDIVGDGNDRILYEYKEMVQNEGIGDKVKFHGRLHGDDLDNIYDRSLIGVNSLAIHRQNLDNESTLKTREYAAKGLPIISSSFVDVFSKEDNKKYVYRVPADDSPIDIDGLLKFYEKLVDNQDVQELKKEIRKKSFAICDMAVTLKPVIEFMNEYE